MREPLSSEYIRKVARLARLRVTDEEVATFGEQLSSVLGYIDRLSELDLKSVEPLTNVGDATNRLDEDVPGPVLPNEALRAMSPEAHGRFVKVPKVLDEGGGGA